MNKAIKNLKVTWDWKGDKYALKGFNIMVLPDGSTPTQENPNVVAIATTPPNIRSYIFKNVTLDTNVKYNVWIQSIYENDDSVWINNSGGLLADDGVSSIATIGNVNKLIKGIGMKVNYSDFNTVNNGEIYFHGFDEDGNASDIDPFILINGQKTTLKKGMLNPNMVIEGYIMYDTTNDTWNIVKYDKATSKWLLYREGVTGTQITLSSAHYFLGYAILDGAENVQSAILYNSLRTYKDVMIDQLVSTAQQTADNAKTYTDALASDSKITPDEKISLKQQWSIIKAEANTTNGTIRKQATDFALSTTSFDSAFSALTTYLVTTIKLFDSTGAIVSPTTILEGIVRSDWDTKWSTYYNERTNLLNAIAKKSKDLADSANSKVDNIQVGGRNLLPDTDFGGVSKKYTKPIGGSTEGGFTFTPTIQVESVQDYTIRAKVRGLANLNLYLMNTGGNVAIPYVSKSDMSATDYKLFTLTFKVPFGKTLNQIYICTKYGDTLDGDWFEIAPDSLILVKGNVVGDWQSAPEDIQHLIETAQITADKKTQFWYQPDKPVNDRGAGVQDSNLDKYVNDVWYDTLKKLSYIFVREGTGSSITYTWKKQDVPQEVFDKIDQKKTVFTAQPIPPYSLGDLWLTDMSAGKGDVYKCVVARASGSYVATDWAKATRYTDDTSVNNYVLGNQLLEIDNTEITLFPFDKNLCSTNGLNPLKDGSVPIDYVATIRPLEGKFGGCVAIEEDSQNIIELIGGESQNWSMWQHWNDVKFWQTSVQYKDTEMGMVFKGTANATAGACIYNYYLYTFKKDEVYTFSVWVKLDKTITSNCVFVINSIVSPQPVVASCTETVNFVADTWTHLVFTCNAIAQDVQVGTVRLNIDGTGGAVCEFAYPQLEKKPYATSFVSGVRKRGHLYYSKDIFPLDSFSVGGWFKVIRFPKESTNPTSGINGDWYLPVFEYAPTTNQGEGSSGFSLCIEPDKASDGYLKRLRLISPVTATGTISLPDNAWYFIVVTFDGSSYKVYLNGNLTPEISVSSTVKPQSFANSVFMVGGGYCGCPNTLSENVFVTSKILADYEQNIIYNMNKAMYDKNVKVNVPKPTSVQLTLS